jgi:UDP-glucose 4-epimerase
VLDLVEGHLKALDALQQHPLLICNLGTGKGYSVLEMVAAFARAAGRPIPYRIAPRRPGDVAACYADPARARQLLGWQASRDLAQMCHDHWAWQSGNPEGYS